MEGLQNGGGPVGVDAPFIIFGQRGRWITSVSLPAAIRYTPAGDARVTRPAPALAAAREARQAAPT